jgi:hypothetical protein
MRCIFILNYSKSTFTLLFVSVYTTIRGKKNAELYKKNIANDLLIKHARELFGEEVREYYLNGKEKHSFKVHIYKKIAGDVFQLLQQGKKDEAESLIISNLIKCQIKNQLRERNLRTK